MKLPLPNKRYQLILADPPWAYNTRNNINTKFGGGAMAHYPVMDYKDIAELPIPRICEDDCVLWLWAVFPKLKEALYVIEKWGFTYKTIGFNWVKTNKHNNKPFFGIGYYTKSNSEVCLLASKGKTIKPATNSISSIIMSPREQHSKKPDIVRTHLERLYPDITKIELFARQKVENWDSWGLGV